MNFLFPLLKLSNKGKKKYFKIILFISFHSISFTPPKRGLNFRGIYILLPKVWRHLDFTLEVSEFKGVKSKISQTLASKIQILGSNKNTRSNKIQKKKKT